MSKLASAACTAVAAVLLASMLPATAAGATDVALARFFANIDGPLSEEDEAELFSLLDAGSDGTIYGNGTDRRDCTGFAWNDGTATGTPDIRYYSPCLGGSGNQRMVGTSSHDTNDKVDAIQGRQGSDSLWGGYGHDRIWGDFSDGVGRSTDGFDGLHGGKGNDFLEGGWGNDGISGGDGADHIEARDGYKDYVKCADSVGEAEVEARATGNVDYVVIDRYDVLSDTCQFARIDRA